MSWINQKTVLVWAIDMVEQVLTLPQTSQDNQIHALEDMPKKAARVSKKKWFCLLSMLHSESLVILGSSGVFSCPHHSLGTVEAATNYIYRTSSQ